MQYYALNRLPVYPAACAGTCYYFLALTAVKDSRIDEASALLQSAATARTSAGPEYPVRKIRRRGGISSCVADLFQQQHRPAQAEEALKHDGER